MLEDKSAQQLYRTATFHELWARTYERGVVRKMQRTPWHSMAQDVGDRRVFWLWCSCCTARAWSSFLHLLQEVSSICKTRNQLTPSIRQSRCARQGEEPVNGVAPNNPPPFCRLHTLSVGAKNTPPFFLPEKGARCS